MWEYAGNSGTSSQLTCDIMAQDHKITWYFFIEWTVFPALARKGVAVGVPLGPVAVGSYTDTLQKNFHQTSHLFSVAFIHFLMNAQGP